MQKLFVIVGIFLLLSGARPAAALDLTKTGDLRAVKFDELGFDPAGLMGWWRFEGNGLDGSGKGNHGTGYGGVAVGEAADRFGLSNRATTFDGVDDYVGIGNLGTLYSQGTIVFWMYPTAVQNYRNPFTTKYMGGNAAIRFEEALNGSFAVVIGNDAGSYNGHQYLSSGLLPDTWYHVVLTWDTVSSKAIGYLNGVEKFNANHDPARWPTVMPNVIIGYGFNNLDRYWKGLVDEVRIFNRILSGTEVLAMYDFEKESKFTIGKDGTIKAAGFIEDAALPVQMRGKKDSLTVKGSLVEQ